MSDEERDRVWVENVRAGRREGTGEPPIPHPQPKVSTEKEDGRCR